MAHASLVATVSRSDRVLVSVLLTIAKRSQKQNVITSPDSDVLPVRACRSRLWLSVGLHWSGLIELNSDFRFWVGVRERTPLQ